MEVVSKSRNPIVLLLILAVAWGIIPTPAHAKSASNCSGPSGAVVATTSKAKTPDGKKVKVVLTCSGAWHIISKRSRQHFGAQVDQRHYNLIMSIITKSTPKRKDGGWRYTRELACTAGRGMKVFYTYTVTVFVDPRGYVVTAYVTPDSVDRRTWDQEEANCKAYAASHG